MAPSDHPGERQLNLAHVVRRSSIYGPGERFVLWVQGCTLRCPGCWNRDTWSRSPRAVRSVGEILALIDAERKPPQPALEGVTFLGGEPMEQANALAAVAAGARQMGLSVMVYTGFELALLAQPAQQRLIGFADLLVTGRYVAAERDTSLRWRGSENQRLVP